MWKNIILDWSGTVVDDLTPVWESTNDVLIHFGRKSMSREEFRDRFALPWIDFYKENLVGIDRDELNKIFWRKMQKAQSEIPLQEGALDFFCFCRDHRLPVFILSTVDAESFWGQSDRLGTSPLIQKACVGVEDKRTAISRLLEENQLDPAQTIMVGDMVHDLEAARAGRVTSCAVLSGFHTREKLMESKPDLIIRDLTELKTILQAQLKAGKYGDR